MEKVVDYMLVYMAERVDRDMNPVDSIGIHGTLKSLKGHVVMLIKDGWEPIGGVTWCQGDEYTGPYFLQAMVRRAPPVIHAVINPLGDVDFAHHRHEAQVRAYRSTSEDAG